MNAIKQYIGGAIVSTALAIGTVGSVQAQVGMTLAQATPTTPSVGLGTDPKPGLTSSVILAGKSIEFSDMVKMKKEDVDRILDGMSRSERREYITYKTQIGNKEEQARISEEDRLANNTKNTIELKKQNAYAALGGYIVKAINCGRGENISACEYLLRDKDTVDHILSKDSEMLGIYKRIGTNGLNKKLTQQDYIDGHRILWAINKAWKEELPEKYTAFMNASNHIFTDTLAVLEREKGKKG